jgi:hypothetical protein
MAAMSAREGALEKIRSEDLRQAAAETKSKPHVVIVEVAIPRPQVDVLSPGGQGETGAARFRISSKVTKSDEVRPLAETRRAIEKILGRPAERFFSSSGAFVVTATGEQIRHLADLPQVRAIWPNETFHSRL